jgi:hypothetical protein
MVTAVSVVRDWNLYNRCLSENPYCKDWNFHVFDNNDDNKPIPERYNSFLDEYDYDKESWFVFCHEDFEPLESIYGKIHCLDRGALYGPIGCKRVGFAGFGMQRFYGQVSVCRRDSDKITGAIGVAVDEIAEVETFDCCCLILHSSLVKKYNLRFDRKLYFDLYVEDFCASAKVRCGINSFILPFRACHHSNSVPTERLRRHLPYLRQKYSNDFFVGTCTYFGTFSIQKKIQDWIVNKIKHMRKDV